MTGKRTEVLDTFPTRLKSVKNNDGQVNRNHKHMLESVKKKETHEGGERKSS